MDQLKLKCRCLIQEYIYIYMHIYIYLHTCIYTGIYCSMDGSVIWQDSAQVGGIVFSHTIGKWKYSPRVQCPAISHFHALNDVLFYICHWMMFLFHIFEMIITNQYTSVIFHHRYQIHYAEWLLCFVTLCRVKYQQWNIVEYLMKKCCSIHVFTKCTIHICIPINWYIPVCRLMVLISTYSNCKKLMLFITICCNSTHFYRGFWLKWYK